MNTEQASVNAHFSARARNHRRREALVALEVKRQALLDRMAGDEQERAALALLSYGQLVARLHGTPPTLPLTTEAAESINREGVVPRGTFT